MKELTLEEVNRIKWVSKDPETLELDPELYQSNLNKAISLINSVHNEIE